MKKFYVIGLNIEDIKTQFINHGFVLDEYNPDFVVSFGGDGTLLKSEFIYPNVPKLFLKNTNVGKLAQNKKNQEVIDGFIKNNYFIKEYKKLKVTLNEKRYLIASNEINIHNANPRSAIRFRIKVDNDYLHHELIGDGVIIANPLGSTGYYKSITDSYFEIGIGVAFNNSTEAADHVVLDSKRNIKIEITRGPAEVFADNQFDFLKAEEGDILEIVEIEDTIKLIRIHDDILEQE